MEDNLLGPPTWLMLGLAFALFELVGAAPFVAVFFAVGALATAVAQAAGWLGPPWAAGTTFIVVSVVPLLALRSRLVARVERGDGGRPVDALVGASVTLLQDLSPHGTGGGTLRGSRWQVRNVGGTALACEVPACVVGLEGLTLLVAATPTEKS